VTEDRHTLGDYDCLDLRNCLVSLKWFKLGYVVTNGLILSV
jgi:hypothetical protein